VGAGKKVLQAHNKKGGEEISESRGKTATAVKSPIRGGCQEQGLGAGADLDEKHRQP